MKITVTFKSGTYCANVDGWNVRSTCTMGAMAAAKKAAIKALNVESDQVDVQMTGGTANASWFTAKLKSEQKSDRTDKSFDQLFNEVFCGSAQ